MNKLLSTVAVTLVLTLSGTAFAHEWESAPPAIDHAISKLPPDKAGKFRDTMKDAHDENREIEMQIHQTREDLYRIMVAPKFDQDAFLDKSNKLRQLHDQAEANLNESFTTAISSLSQNDRKMLANTMRDEHAMHERHGHHAMLKAGKPDDANAGAEMPDSQYPSPANAPVKP